MSDLEEALALYDDEDAGFLDIESVIVAAARAYQAGGQVWWCEFHRAAESAEEGTCEVAGALLTVANWTGKDASAGCRLVKARIVIGGVA